MLSRFSFFHMALEFILSDFPTSSTEYEGDHDDGGGNYIKLGG